MSLRRMTAGGLLAAGCLLLCPGLAVALIEALTPLARIIGDADEVFVAHFDRVDVEKPAAIIAWDADLEGKTALRRLPVNLTGDKEKHTPQFLKRIAPKLPVVLFVTHRNGKSLALGYTNGTWFQLIGTADDAAGRRVRWTFTHCEIYLRRTFTGTTKELIEVVGDSLAGKRKAPDVNPKEPPGFGPEVKQDDNDKGNDEGNPKPEIQNSSLFHPPSSILHPRSSRLFWHVFYPVIGVVTLPFLAPLAALLQLLFPGLLRDQWRRYRIVISVLTTQSTLLAVHWVALRWFVAVRPRWMADDALWGAMASIALVGAVVACVTHWQQRTAGTAGDLRPAPVEYIAVSALILVGILWGAFLLFTGSSPFDQMSVVTIAAACALPHLWFRSRVARAASDGAAQLPARLTTEGVLLCAMVVAAVGLGLHLNVGEENRVGALVTAEWSTFRGNSDRTGSTSSDDPGPTTPSVLWTYDPKERKGRIRMHSSPAVVNGQVYIGALYEVQSFMEGAVYCVNAADGRREGDKLLEPGAPVWRFTAEGSLKPVFSSPSVSAGRVYFGEGYHQDQGCRLFCLDARRGDQPLWTFPTTSHVESSPCIVGSRIYFGAGDDGLLCVDAGKSESTGGPASDPKQIWQLPQVHVDGSCVVAGDRLFVGSVLGDVYHDFFALGVDAANGKVLWRTAAPMPLPASPSYAAGRVFFGLGNGKVNLDAENPAGAVWCLDAASGERIWDFPTAGSVLASPAIAGENVIACSRDGHCYCLTQNKGHLIWNVDLTSPIVASPVIAGGKIYVLTVSGLLACLKAGDGTEFWRMNLEVPDEDAYASPTLADGRLYVPAGGRLLCIGEREAASRGDQSY